MSDLIATNITTVVIGMGVTGISVVRFLRKQGRSVRIVDTHKTPKKLADFVAEFPDVPMELGEIKVNTLLNASRIVISPGASLKQTAVQAALRQGIPVVGDIQLFLDEIKAPVIAITGSNAKSTVTTLVGEMMAAAGIDVGVGGNIGRPVLDLLSEDGPKHVYVLELSSFQLETIEKLNAEVACILNISEDHMDRYNGLPEYHAAKQRIFFGAKKAVVNRDDALTNPPLRADLIVKSFGLDKPDLKQFGVIEEDGQRFLALGFEKLLPVSALKMVGMHNVANALAALAIGSLAGLSIDVMLSVLQRFGGLPHRCEWVAKVNGVDYINDSKGTNVGATLAALSGLSRLPHKLVLIAGGDGKGADFSSMKKLLRAQVRSVITLGVDGPKFAALAEQCGLPTRAAATMKEAVQFAAHVAQEGDAVLLSPACASLDMFNNYMHRGEQFVNAVQGLAP